MQTLRLEDFERQTFLTIQPVCFIWIWVLVTCNFSCLMILLHWNTFVLCCLVDWLTGMIAKKCENVEVMCDGKWSFLVCLLLRIDFVTISRPKRNYILTEQILEVVISKWQFAHLRTVICFLEGSQYTGLARRQTGNRLQYSYFWFLLLLCSKGNYCPRLFSSRSFFIFDGIQRIVIFFVNLLTRSTDSAIFTL